MSHLDELDEFEAELELRLKKEYTAVFGLFRYCVLTQDATYLCNKLDLNYVPQPSYPFFHLKMEDVWVWDKNRPTRIIPRAEIYTSSDVTVEELRGEGDEPRLTAEALAEKIGESLSSETTSSPRTATRLCASARRTRVRVGRLPAELRRAARAANCVVRACVRLASAARHECRDTRGTADTWRTKPSTYRCTFRPA